MFELKIIDEVSGEVRCYSCKTNLKVEWANSLGIPIEGRHEAKCPKCHNKIKFGVEIHVDYYPRN